MNPEVITLAQQLIRKPSFTPDDAGCIPALMNRMSGQGFMGHHHRFGEVDNVLIWHGDKPGPCLLFLGHTDVVPVGDEADWSHPPLSGLVKDGMLHGRGAADMKGSVAAMILAMEKFVAEHKNHPGKVAIMLTSDEEGEAADGVRRFGPMMAEDHHFDFCLVGEPSSTALVGDTVRVGRRGSLHVNITINGQQGHVAYPQLAQNPIFTAAPFLAEAAKHVWDEGNADFPPTSFQVSNIQAGTGAANVIPGRLHVTANFRYSPESSRAGLEQQLKALLDQHKLDYELDWALSGEPFHCQNDLFKNALKESIQRYSDVEPDFNTQGGTSDGRFIAPLGIDTMELGPINKTIHQVDECVPVKQLMQLENIYLDLIKRLLLS